jgi:hypothetical protein
VPRKPRAHFDQYTHKPKNHFWLEERFVVYMVVVEKKVVMTTTTMNDER